MFSPIDYVFLYRHLLEVSVTGYGKPLNILGGTMSRANAADLETLSAVRDNSEQKRYTYRQLNTQARQAFRRVQISRADGGEKQNYVYKGWELLINSRSILQIIKYDVVMAKAILKQSSVITL